MNIASIMSWGRRRRSLDRAGVFCNALGPGFVFRGALTGTDNSIVFGTVEGHAELDGSLVLAPGSSWIGDIVADIVIVSGKVYGNIVALRKLELTSSAHVDGDLTSPRIALARGAVYTGKILSSRNTHKIYFEDRRTSLRSTAFFGSESQS